jgi:hypothetical protein
MINWRRKKEEFWREKDFLCIALGPTDSTNAFIPRVEYVHTS